jgi:hypothetical protein
MSAKTVAIVILTLVGARLIVPIVFAEAYHQNHDVKVQSGNGDLQAFFDNRSITPNP